MTNPYGLCTFKKDISGSQVTIAFHVDDLLITSVSSDAIDDTIAKLRAQFTGVSVTRGAKNTYLGMQLTLGEHHYCINMSGYLEKILQDVPTAKQTACPAAPDLMSDDENSPLLEPAEQKSFHSEVTKILFIAKRVRMQ